MGGDLPPVRHLLPSAGAQLFVFCGGKVLVPLPGGLMPLLGALGGGDCLLACPWAGHMRGRPGKDAQVVGQGPWLSALLSTPRCRGP